MKKLLYLVLLIMLFNNVSLSGQTTKKSKEKESKDFEFTEGAEIKERKLSLMSSMAGYDGNNTYLIGFRPKGIILFFVPIVSMRYIFQSYNMDNMSLDKAYRQNAFSKQFKNNRFVASDMINEEPYMFTYENVTKKGKKSVDINYYSIDKSTMKPSAKNKLVTLPKASVPSSSKWSYVMGIMKNMSNNEERISGVNYLRSPDKKTFYIITIVEEKKKTKGGKKNKSESYLVYVNAFDNNFESLWEKQEKVKFDNAGTIFTGLDADNIGNVYFTVKDYKEKRKGESKKQGIRNYEYKLYYIGKDKEDLQEVKLNLDNKFVTEMNVKVFDDSVGAVCTGFYYDDNSKRKQDNVSGAFVGLVDKDSNEMLDENFYEFGEDLYSQDVKVKTFNFFGKQKGAKQDEKGTEDIELRKVYVRPDGKIIVTGERYYMYVVVTTTTNGRTTTTRREYHYIHNDVLVTCITPAGQTEWSVRIPKYQHQVNGTYLSSFIPIMVGNNVYFIYNDHQDNAKLTTSGTFSYADLGGKKSTVVCVKVDEDGEVNKYKLSGKKDLDGMVCISGANNIDNKKIVLPIMGRWGRLLKFGIVDFKAPKD